MYWVGPENDGLRFLFEADRLLELEQISPIFLYGEPALGKTALAITLAVRWSRATDQRPLAITTGEQFCNEYAAAVEIDDIDAFRQKYRLCKMLVLDGLAALAGKYAAQDELAATLDALEATGRPSLVTNAVLPAAVKGIKASLASRLCAGYSLQLRRPSRIARRHLIESLVAKLDPLLPIEQLLSIVENLPSSDLSPLEIRDLVRIAHQNRSASGMFNTTIVTSLMNQQLRGLAPNISNIAKSVCRKMHVKLLDVRGSSRQARIVRARSVSIYLARKLTTLSLLQIGEYFSGRDHSTILHSINKIDSLMQTDGQLANLCRDVEAELVCFSDS